MRLILLAVVTVADTAVTVVSTTVKVGATVDVAAAGVKAATGSDNEKTKPPLQFFSNSATLYRCRLAQADDSVYTDGISPSK